MESPDTEFTMFDSVHCKTGNMPPTSWSIDETFHYSCVFLWPPVYRSPGFPVFFYSGKRISRQWKLELSKLCKGETFAVTQPAKSSIEDGIARTNPEYLAHVIRQTADNMFDSLLFRSQASTHLFIHPLQLLSRHSTAAGYSVARLLLKNIFTKMQRRFPYAQLMTASTVTTEQTSATNSVPVHSELFLPDYLRSRRDSSCLSRSHSAPSLSPATCGETKSLTGSKSLPELKLKSSFEEFTPDISVDEDDETYRFQCSCPGLYQCTVTGLVFHMEGEGDVVYRTVPWNRRLLSQHHKKPAGPLFDIKCLQQCVCQLHLPHCEILSTGGSQFLSVAHVSDEGIEFIRPQKITETHVVINITGFSGYGNVKDEDSPPDPVRALVLLFYRPPDDPDPESFLSVLLLPKNVTLRNVLHERRKLNGDERYIETSPHCKLQPDQPYTLSTCPADDSVLVQPTEAEFDSENYDNYFPSFQVVLGNVISHIKLFLRDTSSSLSVWERQVCLRYNKERNSCGWNAVNPTPNLRLLDVRSSFIDGISEPVLKSLLDKLLEKTVITDSERESVDEKGNKRDKARFVIDTVRKKGEAASSEMIKILCEVDPFLCDHLGLM